MSRINVPVTFLHKGNEFEGILVEISGGGATMFHMLVNNYYHGCLVKVQGNKWQYSTQKDGIIKDLGEHFGREVDNARNHTAC